MKEKSMYSILFDMFFSSFLALGLLGVGFSIFYIVITVVL